MSHIHCSVPNCKSEKWKNIELSFHKFPAESQTIWGKNEFGVISRISRRQEWIKATKIKRNVSENMKVCSKHFLPEDFCLEKQNKVLKRSVVPSVDLPSDSDENATSVKHIFEDVTQNDPVALATESELEAAEALLDMLYDKDLQTAETLSPLPHSEDIHEDELIKNEGDCSANMECDNEEIHETPTEEEVQAADNFIESLYQHKAGPSSSRTFHNFSSQSNIQKTLCDFIKDDKTLTTATGLCSENLLRVIVECVEMIHKDTRLHKLSIHQRTVLTFVKLKWNLPYTMLAILFCISSNLCKTYFLEMIKLLAIALKPSITFPSKQEISENMPLCFKNFEDTRVVFDCTEILTEKSKCLCCRIRFYSHYKSSQTVKFMTGVSPAGLITFISKAYGGRASDKAIFEESKVVDLLEKGDAIMVDKGFLIEDTCSRNGIKLYRPPFLRSNNQLSSEDVAYNTKIAAARIHIERTNQRIKVFRILGGKLPWHLVHLIDDIFTIACAVTNLSSPVLATDKFMLE